MCPLNIYYVCNVGMYYMHMDTWYIILLYIQYSIIQYHTFWMIHEA